MSFYATEDPGDAGDGVSIYVNGDFVGEVNKQAADASSIDCKAAEWPREYLEIGEYFIEYYKDDARYASQTYTVTADDLGACIPLLAYP